jgi:glycosyltransferase involved in cell wall biosynthesis
MEPTTKQELAVALEEALRRVLDDPELRRRFWSAGYAELAAHASNGASQWIGRRLLVALIWAAVGAGLTYLVKTGAIK